MQVRAETKQAACDKWKNDPLSASIQAQLAAAEIVPATMRTPDQAALIEWLNRDKDVVKERQSYCGA